MSSIFNMQSCQQTITIINIKRKKTDGQPFKFLKQKILIVTKQPLLLKQ